MVISPNSGTTKVAENVKTSEVCNSGVWINLESEEFIKRKSDTWLKT